MWHNQELHEIYREALSLQNRVEYRKINENSHTAQNRWHKDFIRLMTNGKATSAIRMLSSDGIRDRLSILHPEACELNPSLELEDPLRGMCEHYSDVFLVIDAQTIISVSGTVQGSGGPSGTQAKDCFPPITYYRLPEAVIPLHYNWLLNFEQIQSPFVYANIEIKIKGDQAALAKRLGGLE
ncbi:hypothetical protein GJ496_011438 [Pomphorhynchus laevis]|nr:hypothetical protein GJ496_011438 [Pomphorhynchus laevis]